MNTVSVQINVPQEMEPLLRDVSVEFERNAMILYPYIQNLTISHGRAAEILGVHKLDLIELYNRMGLPYLNQSGEELDKELAAFHASRGTSA